MSSAHFYALQSSIEFPFNSCSTLALCAIFFVISINWLILRGLNLLIIGPRKGEYLYSCDAPAVYSNLYLIPTITEFIMPPCYFAKRIHKR